MEEQINSEMCILCQKKSDSHDNPINKLSLHSLNKIKESVTTRLSCKDNNVLWCYLMNLFEQFSPSELIMKEFVYHKKCYSSCTNKTNIDRIKKKYEQMGTPSVSRSDEIDRRQQVRTNVDLSKCIFCYQEKKDYLHTILTENMCTKLKEIFNNCNDSGLKQRLSFFNNTEDRLIATALEIKYHKNCFRHFERLKNIKTQEEVAPKDNIKRRLAQAELVNIVKTSFHENAHSVLNMNDVQNTYLDILNEYGISKVAEHYKPVLKELIKDNIPKVIFKKPRNPNKPEQILLVDSLEISTRPEEESFNKIYDVAQLLRAELHSQKNWKFVGNFNDYEDPPLLYTFCKALLYGNRNIQDKSTLDKENGNNIKNNVSVLCQHIVQASKSKKQVEKTDVKARNVQETPLSVGLALDLHKTFRSELLIDILSKLNITVTYQKLLNIENSIQNSICERLETSNINVSFPPWLRKNKFAFFAIDNIDFLEATPSGMNTLHGTVTAVFQENQNDDKPELLSPPLILKRDDKKKPINFLTTSETSAPFIKLKPQKFDNVSDCISLSSNNEFASLDMSWIISSVLGSSEKTLSTWSGFNSLLLKESNECNVSLLAPLLRSPPTNYDTFYNAIKGAQAVNRLVFNENIVTVITLDMQLYEQAMKFWTSDNSIQKEFLFRPGELHIVFWSLAALGKYVEGSGIDQAWIEAGLYNTTTVNKILSGKQYYRALHAHTVTILALCDMLIEHVTKFEEKEYYSKVASDLFEQYVSSNKNNSQYFQLKATDSVNKFSKLITKMNDFALGAKGVKAFIFNYIEQFQTILMFIRATREKNFDLHLFTINKLIPYFFAHNHYNYARLLPLYLSSMTFTKNNNSEVWTELKKGNFCVSKSKVPFTAIGPDHAIEHENKKLKITGGIVGITQKQSTLDRFFIIAPELCQISDRFKNNFGFINESTDKNHYQLHSPVENRLKTDYLSLKEIFFLHMPKMFNDENDLCNLLTRKIVSPDVAHDIINRKEIGEQKYQEFVKNRLIEGVVGIWEPMKQVKLKTFKNANLVTKNKNKEKTINIIEQRNLLHRLLIISRKRGINDLKENIGSFEFGVIPRSLFAADGTLLLATDKFSVMHILEEKAKPDTTEIVSNNSSVKNKQDFIIIDGMALVQSIKKTSSIKTCGDFAQEFIYKLEKIGSSIDNVYLIFDVYKLNSLKNQTRIKRTHGQSTYYHVTEATLIKNITLKEFLSSTQTKAELTEYLGQKVLEYSKSAVNKLGNIIVSFNNKTYANTAVPNPVVENNHEEADTLIILHSINIAEGYGKNVTLKIYSSDTDVLILLVNYYNDLPEDTIMIVGTGEKRRQINIKNIFNAIGSRRSKALIGLHAFTGTDITGKFFGRSKETCIKAFFNLKEEDSICDTLTRLGNVPSSTQQMIKDLERFVCLLYKTKTISSIKELRWHLFSNKGLEGENLPPTPDALKLHIDRENFAATVWKKAHKNIQNLPKPESAGWSISENNMYDPIPVTKSPAPDVILNLVKCGCKKGCSNKSCSCKKNDLPCTEACGCMEYDCSNNEVITVSEIEADEMDVAYI